MLKGQCHKCLINRKCLKWLMFLQGARLLVSTYVVRERLSVMQKQVSVQLTSNSKFLSKFSRKPLSGISDQKVPPKWKTSVLRWPKFTPEYLPPNEKLQIWDDQSLLWNTPQMKNFRFEMTKVYSRIPPQMKNFRFEMTKVYSGIPPPSDKLQIWDDQSLLQNTPPPRRLGIREIVY